MPDQPVPSIDEQFRALPLDACADAALSAALAAGAASADLRIERTGEQALSLMDGRLEGAAEVETSGLSVRVVVDGAWGFAAASEISAAAAVAAARQAVDLARACRPLTPDAVDLADEPVHHGEWVSQYRIDPFAVPESQRLARLVALSAILEQAAGVDHVQASVRAAKEIAYFAGSTGTRTLQQRVRIHPAFTAIAVAEDGMESLRTLAPPAGRGWEYLTGDGWDFEAELAEIPEQLAEKVTAPSIEPGRYDLLIDPSNLWLTIHESVGHATELDRALGYEANYAGTSFATPDLVGQLQYGSALMSVTGDRTARHGLATVGWDHEGVAAQQWDLVRDGILVGYQLDRRTARQFGVDRSNGCAYADAPQHAPLQRMANVSLAAEPDGPDFAGLVAGIEDGIAVLGDKSWSIDMQRYNFQFTGQRFLRIRGGAVVGQVKDVAYQATTTDFWGSLVALGGPQTWVLGGAFNCGKGQPGQVAAVSHGCPAAVFSGINVLNARQEAGR